MTTIEFVPTDPRPAAETTPVADRATTNPMFNDQPMKLGCSGSTAHTG
jgi:FMNH2-dependent dimethyl sulfone monooxygenase